MIDLQFTSDTLASLQQSPTKRCFDSDITGCIDRWDRFVELSESCQELLPAGVLMVNRDGNMTLFTKRITTNFAQSIIKSCHDKPRTNNLNLQYLHKLSLSPPFSTEMQLNIINSLPPQAVQFGIREPHASWSRCSPKQGILHNQFNTIHHIERVPVSTSPPPGKRQRNNAIPTQAHEVIEWAPTSRISLFKHALVKSGFVREITYGKHRRIVWNGYAPTTGRSTLPSFD